MTVSTPTPNLPDYEQLVKFLFQPFLSEPEAIGVDCEYTIERQRIWLRVAVATADRDTAFGRGGRNIQAIRTVLQAAATAVGQSIYLDVYGYTSNSRQMDSSDSGDAPRENRSSGIKPTRRSAENGDTVEEMPSPRSSVPPPRRK
ncbi:MAG: KH domain-containing protein [Chamaesiphon sp.]|nr:KH domain-containing protein [Chamaesiphon sp.]